MSNLEKEVQKQERQSKFATTVRWTWLNKLMAKQVDAATALVNAKTRFFQAFGVHERAKAELDDIDTVLEMDEDERKTDQIDAKIRRKKAEAELDKLDGVIDVTPAKKTEPSQDTAPPKDATHAGIMD